MGYVDKTTKVTLDAFLTQRGRQLLLSGNTNTKISYFGLGDSDINYKLKTVNDGFDLALGNVPDMSGDVGDCLKSLVDGVTQKNMIQYQNDTTNIVTTKNYIRLAYDNNEIGSDNIPYVVNNFDIDLREYVNFLRNPVDTIDSTNYYWYDKNTLISNSGGQLTNNNFSNYLHNYIKISQPYTQPAIGKKLLLFKDTIISTKKYVNGSYDSIDLGVIKGAVSINDPQYTYTPLNPNLYKRMFWNVNPKDISTSGNGVTSNIIFGIGQLTAGALGTGLNAGFIALKTIRVAGPGSCTGTTFVNPKENKHYNAAIKLIDFIKNSPDFEVKNVSGNTRYVSKERIYIEIDCPGYSIVPKPVISFSFYFDNIGTGEYTLPRTTYLLGLGRGPIHPELNNIIIPNKYMLPDACHDGPTA
jgi:hypothetical protein